MIGADAGGLRPNPGSPAYDGPEAPEEEQEPRIYVGVIDEGSEVLITIWPDDTATIATRPAHTRFSWGPPSPLTAR